MNLRAVQVSDHPVDSKPHKPLLENLSRIIKRVKARIHRDLWPLKRIRQTQRRITKRKTHTVIADLVQSENLLDNNLSQIEFVFPNNLDPLVTRVRECS